jgi:hypothetical protein
MTEYAEADPIDAEAEIAVARGKACCPRVARVAS